MDVLVVGWSDIVRRRVLPALASVPGIGRIHLATGGVTPEAAGVTGTVWAGSGSVEAALEASPGVLVYVSGINTDHAARVESALVRGHHVIVDKPAFVDRESAQRCLALARAGDLMLAEATVWAWHAQVRSLLAVMAERGWVARQARSTFTIPALPTHNFRVDPHSGGGVVADMAAYALSPGRVLGGGDLVACDASGLVVDDRGLDLGFTVHARYRSGLQVQGSFSIDGSYANRLEVSGDDWQATLSPAFSSKPDTALAVHLSAAGADLGFTAPPSDPFAAFLESALTTGPRDPLQWTTATAASAGDTLRLAAACGRPWGDSRGVD